MGEILEEGDKDDEEKKGGGEGQEGTEKNSTESREGGNEDAAAIKEVCGYKVCVRCMTCSLYVTCMIVQV